MCGLSVKSKCIIIDRQLQINAALEMVLRATFRALEQTMDYRDLLRSRSLVKLVLVYMNKTVTPTIATTPTLCDTMQNAFIHEILDCTNV